MWDQLKKKIGEGDFKALARSISLVENEAAGYDSFLQSLAPGRVPVIGITGPPGAGKSTLTDSLISELIQDGKKLAILCVDPSSPFNLGSLLGDRIRMSQWYNNSNVYIRSLASRGSLGGLHPSIIEITDILRSSVFDYILVETVGVGQSEVEIAGLADVTIVVLVPEAGDEIQTMKAGLMEIADIFVINKADRPDADLFVKNLRTLLAPAFKDKLHNLPIIKTIATQREGTEALHAAIMEQLQTAKNKKLHFVLLAQKAWYLIQKRRMKDLQLAAIASEIEDTINQEHAFNLYSFVNKYQKP
ncbi:MAG: methylmalonyl Co-A mutase-associated GTPase MeaB [Ferruginibacter sp.]